MGPRGPWGHSGIYATTILVTITTMQVLLCEKARLWRASFLLYWIQKKGARTAEPRKALDLTRGSAVGLVMFFRDMSQTVCYDALRVTFF